MRSLLVLAAAVAIALPACGGGDDEPSRPAQATESAPSGERGEIAAVLERYAQAIRRRDGATICEDLFSRAVRKVIDQTGGDCERDLIAPAIARSGPEYRVVLQGVVIRGARATARTRVTDRDSTQNQVQPLVRERGSWKLTTPQAERAAG